MFKERIHTARDILNHPLNMDSKFRSLRRYLKWNIGRRFVDEAEYTIELLPDCSVIVFNRENYSTLAYTCHLYDFDDMLFLLHFLRPEDCFGDFSANIGIYSALASTRGAKVLAVEPIPATYRRLCRNFRLNNVQDLPVNSGLGKQRSMLKFTTNHGGMNRVADPRDSSTCKVSVVPADELAHEHGLFSKLLKVDVECFEYPLLEGATELLTNCVEAIIIEMNGSGDRYGFPDEKVDGLLRSQHFSPYRYDPQERALFGLESPNRNGFNTLYIKTSLVNAVSNRTRSAKPVDLPIGLM